LIELILLSFVIAKIKNYKLLPIFKHRSIIPVIIMSALYIYLEIAIWHGDYSLLKYSNIFRIAYFSSFLVLAIHYDLMKVFICSMPLIWIGSALNTIAIDANSGKMPVFISNSWATGFARPDMYNKALEYGDFHVVGDMYTKLIPLCDTWDLGVSIYSIGDFFILSCVFLIVYYSIKASNNKTHIIEK